MTSTQQFYSLDMNEYRFRFYVDVDSDYTQSPLYNKVGIELIVLKSNITHPIYYSQSVSVEVDGNTEIYAFSPNSGFRQIDINTARLIWLQLIKDGWTPE